MTNEADGVIPDPGGGGELEESPRQRASREGRERWESKSEAEKEAHRQKVRDGHRRRREREEGKRGGDSAPKSKKARAASSSADRRTSELATIREVLQIVLTAPSAIGAITGDPWLTSHFVNSAPALADAICEEAARNEAFRAWLFRLVSSARAASVIGAVTMYLAPPLMHYGILPGGALLGVPVKDAPAERRGPRPGADAPFIAPTRGPATAPSAADPEPPAWRGEEGWAISDLNGEADPESIPPLPIVPA